jgi:hypothetical protein
MALSPSPDPLNAMYICMYIRVARWVCEKVAQNFAQLINIICQIYTLLVLWKKVVLKFAPKVNIRPMGENSPNLVTLM